MTRRITAKTGEYQSEGQTKGRYADVGVIMSNDNGEYIILNPSVSLSGVLAQQNALAASQGKPARSSVMCSIFESKNDQGNKPQQSAGYGQGQPQQKPASQANGGGFDEFEDEKIPF